ncbi:DUF4254 domain-containing protein [Actinomycetes bacterium KLBMP 9797]
MQNLRQERTEISRTLRAQGKTWVEIAELFRLLYQVNARVAFRYAHCWNQGEVAKLWCEHWPDDPKTSKNISYWELWPAESGRTPSFAILARLAELYECSVSDLLADLPNYRHRDGANGDRPDATAVVVALPSEHIADRHQGSGQNLLPTARLVVDSFHGQPEGSVSWPTPLRAARRLAARHADQWSAEMISRDPSADDHVVAAAKRSIDLLNRARADLVMEIDTWVERAICYPATASLHTETIGSVIDRLAIAWVRCQRLSQTDRHALALRQFRELACAYDDLVLDVHKGRRRVPRWRALKSSRSPAVASPAASGI